MKKILILAVVCSAALFSCGGNTDSSTSVNDSDSIVESVDTVDSIISDSLVSDTSCVL